MKYFSDVNISDNIDIAEFAYENCHKNFSHEEILLELKGNDDIKKQICIINLDNINASSEAEILANTLTNQSTPIREACAFKINQFMKSEKFVCFFQDEKIIDIFINAINDVNPTVARSIIEIIDKIENISYLKEKLYKKIFSILEELKEFISVKNYLLNKKTFNLYWCLETISALTEKIEPDEELLEIIQISSKFNDYTIREKTAKIVKLYNTKLFEPLRIKLSDDENFYVRRYFL